MVRTVQPLFLTNRLPFPTCWTFFNQEPRDPGESDCLLFTQLRTPSITDRHYVSFKLSNFPDRPDFKRADWTRFQECLEEKLLSNPELRDKEAVDACVGDLSSAILSAI